MFHLYVGKLAFEEMNIKFLSLLNVMYLHYLVGLISALS